MTLNEIEINNFRCFTKYQINLAPKVSVLIGKNGAGKSSLLKAIRYALGFIFSTEEELGEDILIAGNPDVGIETMEQSDFFGKTYNQIPASFASIKATAYYMTTPLSWEMNQRNIPGAKPNVKLYSDAYKHFMETFKSCNILPVYAYFSDSFPHKEGVPTEFANDQLSSYDRVLRTFGYDQWNKEPSFSYMWLVRWLNAIIRDVQQNHNDKFINQEANYVTKKLMEASIPVSKECDDAFQILSTLFRIKDDHSLELWLRLKNGNDILFQNLPAGYLRFYSIVLDICYRHWILNQDPNREPEGVVIIDEVDLHLHPTFAVEVVDRLTRTFPRMQFVLSTHSPIVVSNIKTNMADNKIFRMVYGEEKAHELPDIFGIDYNIALHTVMDSSSSNGVVDVLRSSILRNMRLGKTDVVEAKKEKLKELVTSERYNMIMNEIEKIYNNNL